MQVLSSIEELSRIHGPVALAIGVFDGVHRGHREVIGAALEHAEQHHGTGVVMTFDPHPMRVLRPNDAPGLLCSTRHKLMLLERIGVGCVVVCPFDEAMSRTDAGQFVERLVKACQPLGFVSVGYSWSFGKGGAGNIHRLMELGSEHDFGVYGVPEVKVDGAVVSSTRIREAVKAGDFAGAKRLLGRDYSVLGEVVHGRQLGRQLGFPTANVAVENEQLPPTGVYAVRAWMDGIEYAGVANLGNRPTVGGVDRSLEVHLLDVSGDYYGKLMEVAFVEKLRDEQKFSGVEELKEQIGRDVLRGREIAASDDDK
ncbi:bifunctional riboflavin kinase/FAD synthetase [Phragmitibacter flavus]|uniref:Riboflavin biosynthesis protein n=1 Tax=Phragmitibacter flavus TaxID=2576071 RepID=A0A5R8K8A2_9BACT|nr:bifunctional riboflavin kinase/FAD synthetase [Phragmitibacter flavus]TLD68568.1 bifunctional riboflavin kinase/FAD synthetase [Phragmitibacter flavus]